MSGSQSTRITPSDANQPHHPRPACRDFSRRVCARGTACEFSHDESIVQARRSRTSETSNDSTGMGRTYTCEKAGAVVTYGDGAMVTKLSLPSNFSAVRVTGLGGTVSKREVALLLSQMGRRPVGESNVTRLWKVAGETEKTAEVQVKDPMFVGLLRCQEAAALGVKAIPISPMLRVPGSPTTRKFDCRKVVCTWERPTRELRLQYDNEDTTRQIYEKFHSGEFTIPGGRVKANAPTEMRDGIVEPAFKWRVELGDAAGTDQAQVDDLRLQVPKHHWPDLCWASDEYTYDVNDTTASDNIQSLLQPFRPLDHCEIYQTHKARTMLLFNDELRLSVQLIDEANFKIPARFYDTVREQIDQHKRDCETAHVSLVVSPTNSRFRDLKLEGEDSGAFAKAQEKLQQILNGRVVCEQDGKIHQIPIAISRWRGLARFSELVERRYPVLVRIDVQERQVRIIGPDQSYDSAAQMLLSLLKVCYWKRAPTKPQVTTTAAPKAADCSVCWTEPQAWEIIKTLCGHTYCKDCFAHLAHSTGTSTTQDFSCVAESCDTVFPLSEIQRYVPPETFEQILDASLASYIARGATHGKILRYCPTPDCGNIFQSTATLTTEPGSDTQTCHKFFNPVCTNCHVPHIGMSCAEYLETQTGGDAAFEAVKKELGVKDCPKCGMSIERTGECNHVWCQRGCGAHICWVCLGTATGDRCYSHMLDVHRRIWEPADVPIPRVE